jgi:gamma-glutamyltranspeptidase / glutathione hydrolase
MKKQNPLLITGIFLLILSSCTKGPHPLPFESAEPLVTKQAMVVSAHPLASEIGKQILLQGGNAFDAAIAVNYALAVVHPAAGNIGGGGFMVMRLADGTTDAINYREMAPQRAHRDMYLDSAGNVIDKLSLYGHLAAGVPGTVAGTWEVHQKYGSLPWHVLIQPAIDLAENGFLLTEKEARGLNSNRDDFIKYSTVTPEFLDRTWQAGDTIRWEDLGRTLERIRENGPAGFYEGETARFLVEEMERGGGWISYDDLKNYKAQWTKPVNGTYKGYVLHSMSPPSSGGIALIQMLQMVEDLPLGKWGWNSPLTVHAMTEAQRRVYADRAKWLGDPDFFNVPMSGLLDPAYNKARMQDFNYEKATPSSSINAGIPALESEETTHYSIIDALGNAVAVTTTINGSYGNKVVVSGAGFILNNEMDDFSVKPGHPNMFGLVGGEANAVAPGKRMLSAMTPTIIEKDGRLVMVVGTPGGSTIITSVFQTLLNVLEHNMNMQQAVTAPRVHSQWLPDQISMEENALDEATRKTLEAMGHTLHTRRPYGRVDAIRILPDGKLEAGADPRGDDAAAGY